MLHHTRPGLSPRYSPCDSVSTKPQRQRLRLPSLKVRDFFFAHSHPCPLLRLPRRTAPAYRLRLSHRTASTLSYVVLSELLPPPVYTTLSVPSPASRLRLSHRTASTLSYVPLTEPPLPTLGPPHRLRPTSPMSPSPNCSCLHSAPLDHTPIRSVVPSPYPSGGQPARAGA